MEEPKLDLETEKAINLKFVPILKTSANVDNENNDMNKEDYSKIISHIKYSNFKISNYLNNLIPSNEELIETETYRKQNKYLYHYIINKEYLPKEYIEEIEINPDGNCFYNNLSYFYTGKEVYHRFFRMLIYIYIKENEDSIIINSPYILIDGDKNIDTDKYIENIKKDTFYAGDMELSNCIKIFDLNIAIYIKENNTDSYKYKFLLYFSNNDDIFNTDLYFIILIKNIMSNSSLLIQ